MATRFYLPSVSTPDVTTNFDTGWEDTSAATRIKTYTEKVNTAMTTVSFADANNADKDILFRQYISAPITAQTLSAQTIKFQIRAAERIAGNNMFTAIGIRVVSNDGSSVTGTVLAITRDGLEVDAGATLENRQFSATSTQVISNGGDRIVIEIGTGGNPANSGGADHDSDLRIGDVSASDLAENDTETTDNNPWVEFANTITFVGANSIAFDSKTDGTGFQNVTEWTFAHTCTGSNLLLIVSAGGDESDTYSITGITYNAVSMTLVNSARAPANRKFGQWFLLGPATGSNNVVVTASPAGILACSGSYNNVKQTGQPDASITDTSSLTTSIETSITTVADNCWAIHTCHAATSGQAPTAGAGAFVRSNVLSDADLFDSNSDITPAGSYSMTVQTVANSNWAVVIGSYAPAQATVPVTSKANLLLMGVG